MKEADRLSLCAAARQCLLTQFLESGGQVGSCQGCPLLPQLLHLCVQPGCLSLLRSHLPCQLNSLILSCRLAPAGLPDALGSETQPLKLLRQLAIALSLLDSAFCLL